MSYHLFVAEYNHIPVVKLENKSTGEYAIIALRGATLLKLVIRTGEKLIDVVDGYFDVKELESGSAARSAIMVPFSNKIENNRYVFDDCDYQLSETPTPPMMHGFLRNMDTEIKEKYDCSSHCKVVLTNSGIRKDTFPGYPFDLSTDIIFELFENRLNLEIRSKNKSTKPAPYFTGWHPYFKIGSTPVNDHIICLESETIISTDANYLPLPGNEAYLKIGLADPRCFSSRKKPVERRINDKIINYCYTSIEPDSDGRIKAELISESENTKLKLSHTGKVFYIFTGDGLPIRPRNSIALEPVELMTNAFNRSEHTMDIRLLPEESKTFFCSLEWSPLK
ncbi:MAG: aldose 1-epimerase [Ignavibacteriaceae bacterium]|nr:aldose 1-epimerase [Ignavibacteriaceae bacterium]